MFKILFLIVLITIHTTLYADCVFGAKQKQSFQVLSNNRILLTGGIGSDILIKTFCFPNRSSSIQVLKDSFCSYESSVLYIDGEVCDANDVTSID